VLANVVLCHVPVVRYNFGAKLLYMAVMVRRMAAALLDPSCIDDRDYYGNKRLELAGGCWELNVAWVWVWVWLWMLAFGEVGCACLIAYALGSNLLCTSPTTPTNNNHRNTMHHRMQPPTGGLMSLLFEDLFKRLNADLKRQADIQMSKASRASAFDVARQIRAGECLGLGWGWGLRLGLEAGGLGLRLGLGLGLAL